MNTKIPIRLGLSQPLPCSYLPEQNEQLLVAMDEICFNPIYFEQLLAMGFRRSGDQVYRPHCPSCQKCKPLRVLCSLFSPSKSQKRKINYAKNHYQVKYSHIVKDEYFTLYDRYIRVRHSDGSMYPPDKKQYESFLLCSWLPITYIELWCEDKLIAVAVTDQLPNAMSAIYTFFDPQHQQAGLGAIMIMEQIKLCQQMSKAYLYLGFQIDECAKMNYKNQYKPHQIFTFDHWQDN